MKVVNRLKAERVNSGLNVSEAEHVGTAAFAYLASDPELFSRFASITGIELSDIAAIAGSQEFLAGVLEYFLTDESILLSFCENNDLRPENIQKSYMVLSGNMGGS